jgi:hypothetical protein
MKLFFFATSYEIMGSWVDNSLMDEDMKKIREACNFWVVVVVLLWWQHKWQSQVQECHQLSYNNG